MLLSVSLVGICLHLFNSSFKNPLKYLDQMTRVMWPNTLTNMSFGTGFLITKLQKAIH